MLSCLFDVLFCVQVDIRIFLLLCSVVGLFDCNLVLFFCLFWLWFIMCLRLSCDLLCLVVILICLCLFWLFILSVLFEWVWIVLCVFQGIFVMIGFVCWVVCSMWLMNGKFMQFYRKFMLIIVFLMSLKWKLVWFGFVNGFVSCIGQFCRLGVCVL